jgi:sugar-specific transcriptional regulator TrmB
MYSECQHKQLLEQLGLTDIQADIYYYLLTTKSCTINVLKEALGLSYAQVYNNLQSLLEQNLVGATDSKPIEFYKINPKIALSKIIDKKVNKFNSCIEEMEEKIMISESQQGVCTKDIYHYHFTDLNLAIEKFYDLIKRSKNEITITTLPPDFLKRIEPFLRDAFKRGVKIMFYYSNLDYTSSPNYLDEVSEIFKRLRITLVKVKEKIAHQIVFNNMIVNNGHILIDEGFFNSISFKENKVFFTEGFYGAGIVQQLRHLFKLKTVEKELEIIYPKAYQQVLEIIEQREPIKTRDISFETGISGAKLKEILTFLMEEHKIEEQIDNSGVGRPGAYYSLAT